MRTTGDVARTHVRCGVITYASVAGARSTAMLRIEERISAILQLGFR